MVMKVSTKRWHSKLCILFVQKVHKNVNYPSKPSGSYSYHLFRGAENNSPPSPPSGTIWCLAVPIQILAKVFPDHVTGIPYKILSWNNQEHNAVPKNPQQILLFCRFAGPIALQGLWGPYLLHCNCCNNKKHCILSTQCLYMCHLLKTIPRDQ